MTAYVLPILYALFVWWLSTGLIMYLDGLPRPTFKWSLLGATVLLAICLYRLAVTSTDTSVMAAYAAFTYGLIAWGWHALSFYMGFVTGPRTTACPPGATGLARFCYAAETSLYHELAILIGAVVLYALTRDGDNLIGLWTYLILWWMHLSGKLNVFFGVPNLAEEFIPEHLAYLRSYMSNRPMNLLFPVSVTASTVITALLVQNALSHPAGSFEAVGAIFLATLMALAVLEHWFLVLPMPAMLLWAWSLTSRPSAPVAAASPAAGPTAVAPTAPGGLMDRQRIDLATDTSTDRRIDRSWVLATTRARPTGALD
jgi:putative photosynthetic complex assembly protein 2